ncbi:MAG: C40 family peptidase [Bacteroidia bacterium]
MALFLLAAFLVACHAKRESTASDSVERASVAKYAALFGIPQEQMTNKKLVRFLDEWYGVPYKYGSADKKGIDCSHLTSKIMHDVYGKTVSGTAGDMEKASEHIKQNKLQEGDLVFFKIESKAISHVGVYVTNHHFIHASSKRGVMISDLEEPYFKKYYYSSGRIN